MAVLRLKHVENAPIDGQAVQLVHIEGLDISDGASGGSSEYVLPEASPTTLGGVKTVTDEDFREYMGLEEG